MSEPNLCDFCSQPFAVWSYPSDDFQQIIEDGNVKVLHKYIGDWSSCSVCKNLIDDSLMDDLAARSIKERSSEMNYSFDDPSYKTLFERVKLIHEEFMVMRKGPCTRIGQG